MAVSDSEVENVHRYTIVITETEDMLKKVVLQLEKQVEIIRAFYHEDEQIVYQELALYKVPTDILVAGKEAEKIVRSHYARVLSVESNFTVIEKTGHKDETHALFNDLKPFGILEFVRSGRIAISKPMKTLTSIIEELENNIK
mgnify:FL=1